MIDACFNLIQSKPENARQFRVVAMLCRPELFGSEVAIYTNEEIYQQQIWTGNHEFGFVRPITNKSLAKEWGLVLPAGFSEHGVEVQGTGSDDTGWFIFEKWFLGEAG